MSLTIGGMTLPSGPPTASSGQPVVVELSTAGTRLTIIFGTALLLLFGGFAAYGAISGNIDSDNAVAGRIIASCIALLFLGLGVPMLISMPTMLRSRSFVVDGQGLQYQDRKGRAWACRWSEFDQLRLETAYRPTRTGSRGRVRLIMKPSDPGFAQRHPSMATFGGHFGAGAGEYGMPLGPNVAIAQQLDAAIRSTGVRCYGGLVDTGVIIGPGGYV